jgi:signal transduction histidine kinase
MITAADLRPVDLFDDLPDDELAHFAGAAELRVLEPGVAFFEQGEPPAGATFLLEGTAMNFIVAQGRSEPVGRQTAPTWMMAIAVLTEGPAGVRMVTETPCRLAVIAPEPFRRLVLTHPPVHRRIMRQVAPVMSRITGWEQSRERLAALGTMAAGLAHELNNPAAAARRAAAELADALEVLSTSLGRFVDAGISRETAAELIALQREAHERAATRTALDALDAADAEDDLRDRLEDLGVPEAWRLAEPLAAAGVDADWLDRVVALAGEATGAVVAWVSAGLDANGLAAELREATERMSTLVGAVKTYAYMDRGELVEVDLHEGLETTLTVLAHKLKHTAIEVRRDYDRSLPPVTVHGSELNQVWTNLLDNAIDALDGRGTITVATRRDGPCAVVEVADDGPGIAAEALDRVFEPFFTTKGVGMGTGLGLDAARRIVVERHDGSITVASEPGRTAFSVRLPLP